MVVKEIFGCTGIFCDRCRFRVGLFDVFMKAGSVGMICDAKFKKHPEVFVMRFLSIYMSPERNTPPTAEEMATMGKWWRTG